MYTDVAGGCSGPISRGDLVLFDHTLAAWAPASSIPVIPPGSFEDERLLSDNLVPYVSFAAGTAPDEPWAL